LSVRDVEKEGGSEDLLLLRVTVLARLSMALCRGLIRAVANVGLGWRAEDAHGSVRSALMSARQRTRHPVVFERGMRTSDFSHNRGLATG
jgi:hypothetical protein